MSVKEFKRLAGLQDVFEALAIPKTIEFAKEPAKRSAQIKAVNVLAGNIERYANALKSAAAESIPFNGVKHTLKKTGPSSLVAAADAFEAECERLYEKVDALKKQAQELVDAAQEAESED